MTLLQPSPTFTRRVTFNAAAILLICCAGGAIYAQQPASVEPTSRSNEPMEEVVVEGERLDPNSLALRLMEVIYYHKERAAHNFKVGLYEKSFPDLLRLAKLGFKDEQARVSYIYQYGLGDVPKSNEKALAWLGVAVDGTTRPQYRNRFKQMMAAIPEPLMPKVNELIADYREKYSSDVRGVTCMRSRTGHLDKFTCLFNQQRNKHIDTLMMIAKSEAVPWVLGASAIEASISDSTNSSGGPF